MADEEKQAPQTKVVAPIPAHYFNGFQISLTNSDIGILWQRDGRPEMMMSISFTTAKTLVKLLGDTMTDLEKVTTHEVMTTDVIDRGIRDLMDQRIRNDK